MRSGKLHSSLCNGSTSHIMWCRLLLVFLVGAASAEHFQAWKTDMEYEFNVRGRTLAALHDSSDQYTGIVLRARLTVQPKSEDTLEAKVWKAQYAQIHTKLPGGWKSEISDSMLDLKQFPMSEKVFEIKMKHGIVRDLIVDKDVPNWEVNVLKSVVSQLQVDTQGENLMASRYNQEPEEDRVSAMYKTMEDSLAGKCEVLYDISNLPEFVFRSRPELLPMPSLRGDGEVIEIVKTRNYSNCEQRLSHHLGITGSNKWEPGTNNGKFMSRSSVSRIIITGDLKTFTIQSSVTTNKVIMSPCLHENDKGMVSSRVNVTLVKMGPVSSGPWSTPANPESTGSLVYSFNSPFAKLGEERRASGPVLESRTSEERRSRYLNDLKRQEGSDDSSASSSSRSANSLESDEEHSYLQPKPTLNEAPSIPLLPFFIGYGGKTIDRSNGFDAVSATKTLASQIGSDLQDPNSITDEQTLEKFTILASLIRTMNTEQIAEAQREVYQSDNEIDPHDESQSVRRNTWVAFRDAVAQAGTGPALVTIKNWIKEKKVKSHEAASIIGSLSKTARTPTAEYMETFFELATMPETTSEDFLNSTAMISFAELIRFSQVNHDSAHNRYPVHSFGRLSPKHNPAIFNKYIPYMSEQLSRSIEKRELAKSHVFIRALGNVAHPNILAIFEPFLEGKKPASTFQRTMMVFSMNKLAALRPRLARGVFYRIYQNTAEAHPVRCAAVVFLMSTNPPESMLQRMAEFTNYDHSKHVNAAVKSSIESASKLKTRESQDLATKARNVLSLLNKESYGFEYSMNYFLDNAVEEMNVAYRSHVAYIGSEDSFFPQAFYASMKPIYGDFHAPKSELAAMVSSVKELYTQLRKQLKPNSQERRENSQGIQFSPENIAKLLKIRGDDSEDLEGAFWMNTKFKNMFMSFDKDRIRRIPELLRKAATSLKDGRSFNMAKLESYDLTLSFPMESGFPFLYTMKVPVLVKLSGSVKGGDNPSGVDGSIDLRFVYSMQVQGRLGFVTPFEHQHYMAGVNKNFQAHAPIHAEFTYNKSDKRVTLKMRPIEQNEKYKLLHYSDVPFTAQHDILNITPIMMDKRTHKLKNFEPWTRTFDIGSRTRGLNLKLESERVEPFSVDGKWDWDLLGKTAFSFADDKTRPSKTEVTLIPNPSSEQSVVLTGSIETLQDDTTKYDETKSKSSPKGKVPKIKSKKMNDPERRSELIKEASKGIAAADAFAVDLGVELPGQEPAQWFMTMAFANSEVDEKSRAKVYWKFTDNRSTGPVELESCIGLEGKGPRSSMSLGNEKSPSRSFDVDLRFGETCESGFKMQIHGKQEQTDEYRAFLNKLPLMLKCMKEMKRGMKTTRVCHDASVKAATMDKSRLTIKVDPTVRDVHENIAEELRDYISLLPNVQRKHEDEDSIDKDTVMISIDLVQPDDKAKFEIKSFGERLTAKPVDIGPLAGLATNSHPDLSISERLDTSDDNGPQEPTCMVSSDWATTFDESTYPIHLGKCWHVAMTTYPKKNKDQKTPELIDEDMKVSVVVRDAAENKKDVKIVLGKDEFKLTADSSRVTVDFNKKVLDLDEKRSYRQKNHHGDLDFEVLQRADGSITLSSPKHDIEVSYDGEHVQIKASGKYRNDVRGLCGNYDGEPANDFTSPRNCVLSKPEQFAASYAMTSTDCQGPALENWKKASDADCIHETVRLGNVVSDREAGRSKTRKSTWGFHNKDSEFEKGQDSRRKWNCVSKRTKIIEEADQICFSLRPVPVCGSGCTTVNSKLKVMPVYCMPKGNAAQQLVDRIKQGANPDFSQKTPSKKASFDMPVHCQAA